MVDGLGLGANTKAAIIRRGLDEMRRFSQALYPSISDGTFLVRSVRVRACDKHTLCVCIRLCACAVPLNQRRSWCVAYM
jgi:hypothetical protein